MAKIGSTVNFESFLQAYEGGERRFTRWTILGAADKADSVSELTGVLFEECVFEGFFIDYLAFSSSQFERCRFMSSGMDSGKFNGCSFAKSIFRTSRLNGTFSDCGFQACEMESVRLAGSFSGCTFNDGDFINCEFQGKFTNTSFTAAKLDHCSFLDAVFFATVSFRDASMEQAKFHRHTLDGLPNDCGLTSAQKSEMLVQDDSAKLRSSYTGFMNLLHLAALVAFVAPYAVYLFVISMRATAVCPVLPCQSVGSRFWQFIYTGGTMKETAWFALIAFAIALIYNSLRAVLLWKANTLELQRTATGFSPRFSLNGWWGGMYRLSNILFFVNLAALAVHTAHFLSRQLPA